MYCPELVVSPAAVVYDGLWCEAGAGALEYCSSGGGASALVAEVGEAYWVEPLPLYGTDVMDGEMGDSPSVGD